MYLYVLRHGQTDWNIEGKMLSYTDIDLNEEGIEQCIKAKEIIKNLDYSKIFCSPMSRTKHTLEIVNDKNVDILYDNRLVERDFKELEGKYSKDIDYVAYWIKGKDKNFSSETIDECESRIRDFLKDIKEKYDGENILIVTHNGVCRMFNVIFNGYPKNGNIFKYGQDNATVKIYKF